MMSPNYSVVHSSCQMLGAAHAVAGKQVVANCLTGYNSCIFAYGQTGSGKTHTMLGHMQEAVGGGISSTDHVVHILSRPPPCLVYEDVPAVLAAGAQPLQTLLVSSASCIHCSASTAAMLENSTRTHSSWTVSNCEPSCILHVKKYGTLQDRGLIPRVFQELFSQIRSKQELQVGRSPVRYQHAESLAAPALHMHMCIALCPVLVTC